MLDLKQELQSYQPVDLKNLEINGTNILDNIKNSIILYNKALDNLKNGSEDIAIIELKKAVAMNPSFHEAMNLLGVCYSYVKDYLKATELFEKVVTAENNGVKALKYINTLNGGNPAPLTTESKKRMVKEIKSEQKRIINPIESIELKKALMMAPTKYITGFVVGIAVMLLINLLSYGGHDKSVAVMNDTGGTKAIVTDSTEKQRESSKINELNEELENLKQQVVATGAEAEYYKNAIQLYDIEKMVLAKNYRQAADSLFALGNMNFKQAEKEKFDYLYNAAVPAAAWAVFKEGSNLMVAKNYQGALDKLNKVLAYGNEWDYTDNVLYYAGKCYMELGNYKSAYETLLKLKENYPQSKFVQYAEYKIKELEGTP